jgi:hypothetical protein
MAMTEVELCEIVKKTSKNKEKKEMTLTAFIITLLVVVIVASQVYAWTRNNDESYGFTEREVTVFAVSMIDIALVFIVGGIWLW